MSARNSVHIGEKTSRKRKKLYNDEDKENYIKQKTLEIAEIVKNQEATAQICSKCGMKFISTKLFDKHRIAQGPNSACQKRLQNKVIIHTYVAEVFLVEQDTIEC